MPLPFIIMSAPNGARRQKKDHPNIPITPEEMAICAEEIVAAGASILHLHVRDKNGGHSLAPELYRKAIQAVQAAVGEKLIIQVTTEAVGIYDRQQQMDMVKELKPTAVSLALRELCPDVQTETEFAQFTAWLKAEKIFPQYILYNDKDFNRFEEFRKKGILNDNNPFALLVFGNYQGQINDHEINALKACATTAEFPWAACGFAHNEKDCVRHAAHNNGHIRVGFENNIWKNNEEMLKNNAEMVAFASEIAREATRPVATADDVRNIFGLRN